jgi:hypothetical protein
MRIDPDVIEASRPDDREIALLAAEVRRLQAVINSEEPTLTKSERFVLQEVRDIYADEDDVKCNEIAAVLDGLLERTK